MCDINELRRIGYNEDPQFKLSLAVNDQSEAIFECIKITRSLPGKRLSCIGRLNGKAIFAKFFIASKRAKNHWEKEKKGYHLLEDQQIPAPRMLHFGKQGEIYFILFEFLESEAPFITIWSNADHSQQSLLLSQLTKTLANHHDKGIIQQDLHLNNFLLSDDQIYTVDGADIASFDPADNKIASDNLALLFAQFYPRYDKNIDKALKEYRSLRHWKFDPALIDQIKATTRQIREKRKLGRLDKTQRPCSLFDYRQDWNQLSICSRKFQSNGIQEFIQSPDSFIAEGKLLKQGNTCTVAIITIDNKPRVVKRYNIKNWRHLLSRAFRQTRAMRSWTNAHLLEFYGIDTPKPIAIIEQRWGLFRKTAYYLSDLSLGQPGGEFFSSEKVSIENKETVTQSMSDLINSLHQLNISHGDLKISNFIVNDLKASILDLDSMKQHNCKHGFKKARAKDINRFFKNWLNAPTIEALFNNQLNRD